MVSPVWGLTAVICSGPQRMANLHTHFNLDVETDVAWVAFLEVDNSSEVKPTVQTRYLQGSWGIGKGSISVKLGMWSPGWYQAHEPCWEAEFTCCCTAPHWPSSAAPDAVTTAVCGQIVGWVHLPCSYWLPGAVVTALISSFQEGQRSEKQPAEGENQKSGFLHLFVISSWLGVTRWTRMIQITHQWNAKSWDSRECNEIPLTLFYCSASH